MKTLYGYKVAFALSLGFIVMAKVDAMSNTGNNTKPNAPTTAPQNTPKQLTAEELKAKEQQEKEKRNEAWFSTVKSNDLIEWEKLVAKTANVDEELSAAHYYASKIKKDLDVANKMLDLQDARKAFSYQAASAYTPEMSDIERLAIATILGDTKASTLIVLKYEAPEISNLFQKAANFASKDLKNITLANTLLEQQELNDSILKTRVEQAQQKEAASTAAFETFKKEQEEKFAQKIKAVEKESTIKIANAEGAIFTKKNGFIIGSIVILGTGANWVLHKYILA